MTRPNEPLPHLALFGGVERLAGWDFPADHVIHIGNEHWSEA